MKEFTSLVFGSMSPALWAASFLFALIGWAFISIPDIKKRDKHSERTPFAFSFSFWISDNWQRIAMNIIAIFLYIRFMPDLIQKEVKPLTALGVGIGIDWLCLKLRQWNIIDKK